MQGKATEVDSDQTTAENHISREKCGQTAGFKQEN